jgi:DNA (cytosine-5)-methyltransferase 1
MATGTRTRSKSSTPSARRRPASGIKVSSRAPKRELPTSLWTPPPLGDLTFVDMFCGAGGSSLGLTYAGMRLLVGMNHWQQAIDTHSTNFTYAEHLCEDVSKYPLRRLPKADVLWASPICTEMSPAGGKTRRKRDKVYLPGEKKGAQSGQGDLLDEAGYVESEGFERTRATHWNVVEATEIHRYRAVITENVADLAETWELFDLWIQCMCRLGYNVQIVSMNSAHIGDETNPHAPQWRDRIYCVFTRRDVPIPDVELRPIALCVECGEHVRGVQHWAPATLRRVHGSEGRQFLVGRYRRDPSSTYGQYWYVCPNTRCHKARVEPFVRPARDAIDWSDLGGLIGERTGGDVLSPNTMDRIRTGMRRFARPIVATVAGNTYESATSGYNRAWPADGYPLNARTCTGTDAVVSPPYTVNSAHDDTRVEDVHGSPLRARTTKIGEGVVVPPMSVPVGGTWADEPLDVTAGPMRTTMANEKGCESLVVPEAFLTVLRNHADGESLDRPFGTIETGNHQYLTTPPGASDAFYTMAYSGESGRDPERMSRPVSMPFGAMTCTNSHGVVTPPGAYYVMNYGGHAQAHQLVRSTGEPLGPITTRDSHALVVPYYTKGKATSSNSPLDAVTTHDRFALVQEPDGYLSAVDIEDLIRMSHYRMLKPRESARAQRFPDAYILTGGVGAQTMQAGNAVSANAAQFLGERVAAALCRTAAHV